MTRIALLFLLPACLPPMEGTTADECIVAVSQRVDNPVYEGTTCTEYRGYCCWRTWTEEGHERMSCKAPIDLTHRCECPPLHVNVDVETVCAGDVDEGVCYWGMHALECLR